MSASTHHDLHLAPELTRLWPDTCIGLLELRAEVFTETSAIWEEFDREAGPALRSDLAARALTDMPGISEARKAFRAFGADPGRWRVSSEALYRRLRQSRDIYRINSLVDMNNVLSLRTGLSCGIYDAAAIEGDIVLRRGSSGEQYAGLGKGSIPLENIPLLADAAGPFGSPVSDSTRTSVGPDCRDALLVIYCFSGKTALAGATALARELAVRLASALILSVNTFPAL